MIQGWEKWIIDQKKVSENYDIKLKFLRNIFFNLGNLLIFEVPEDRGTSFEIASNFEQVIFS